MITLDKIQKQVAEAIRLSTLTQSEIADKIGVKHQQISCYIYGQKMPSLDTFAKLLVHAAHRDRPAVKLLAVLGPDGAGGKQVLVAVLDLDANEILCVSEYETEN